MDQKDDGDFFTAPPAEYEVDLDREMALVEANWKILTERVLPKANFKKVMEELLTTEDAMDHLWKV